MSFKRNLKSFWKFLKQDTWQSWLVSLILAFLIIKFVFFPGLSLVMDTPLPLVVVESCSMYHRLDFDSWWEQNKEWYENKKISGEGFEAYAFKNGLSKGDIDRIKKLGYKQKEFVFYSYYSFF